MNYTTPFKHNLKGVIFLSRTKFAIIGGDNRYKILKELLEKDGYIVSVYGNMFTKSAENLNECISGSRAVIAPIPVSKDNIKVNMGENFNITIDELLNAMQRENTGLITGGVISEGIKKKAAERGIKAVDIFDMEEVAINNAVPTAEGAIMTAIQESDKVLFKSKVLVTGYGRCGKILGNMLKGMGADVSITFRKKRDEAYINAMGCKGVNIDDLDNRLNKYSFIFNTVPAMLLNSERLKRIRKDALIIDIAQAPGGVDYVYARELNLKALYCPGLPGRVAPFTAAEILKTSIVDVVLDNT